MAGIKIPSVNVIIQTGIVVLIVLFAVEQIAPLKKMIYGTV